MKRLFVVTGVLLAMVILCAGCAAKEPSVVAAAQNVTGELKYLSVPLEGGNVTLTVETPQGVQTIPVADNTTFTIDGKACTIEDIGKALVTGNTTYNCTIVIEPCEPGIVAKYLSVTTIVK